MAEANGNGAVYVPDDEWDAWESDRLGRAAQSRQAAPARESAIGAPAARAKRKSLLPAPPPPVGAPQAELTAWLTVALALDADAVANTTRYGRHDDARLVITLRSGRRVVYDRQADIFNADALVRRVVLSTGAATPPYGKADAQAIAGALVRSADLVEQDDDRAEAREWARTFLEAAIEVTPEHDLSTPAGRYAGLMALRDWHRAHLEPWMSAAERAAVLRDVEGHRYMRVSAFAAHVRGIAGRPIAWGALHGRMAEIGWQGPHELEQRQPAGDQKVKLHVYVVPASWETGDE